MCIVYMYMCVFYGLLSSSPARPSHAGFKSKSWEGLHGDEAKLVHDTVTSLASLLNEVRWNISNSTGLYLWIEFILASGRLTVLLRIAINILLFILELTWLCMTVIMLFAIAIGKQTPRAYFFNECWIWYRHFIQGGIIHFRTGTLPETAIIVTFSSMNLHHIIITVIPFLHWDPKWHIRTHWERHKLPPVDHG
jgi:hypothetical protein